jgi:hypothetical protein
MEVSLNDIWRSKNADIIKILEKSEIEVNKKSLFNKLDLVYLYNSRGDLDHESGLMVSHPLFGKVVQSDGRLENIIAKMSTILYFEEILNEKGLAQIINDFTATKKLYVRGLNKLEVRNYETLELEQTMILAEGYVYYHHIYSQGKLYLMRKRESKSEIVVIDVDSEEVEAIPDTGIIDLYHKIGDLLMGIDKDRKLRCLILTDLKATELWNNAVGISSVSFRGNLFDVMYREDLVTYNGLDFPEIVNHLSITKKYHGVFKVEGQRLYIVSHN